MFKKTKTVASVCSQFTSDLEAIQAEQLAEAERQEKLEANAKLAKEAAIKESSGAANAIKKIKEMFGV